MSRVHLPVIPRFPGDEFQIIAGFSANPARPELDDLAARVRAVSHEG